MITNFVTSLFGIYFVCIFVTYGQENPPIFVDQGLSPEFTGCNDSDTRCAAWADEGECQINAAWMMINCKRSCQSCQGGDVAWKLRNEIAAKYENRTVTEASGKFIINRVKINSIRVSHFEIDETTQLVNMHGKMILTWNDSRIAWDKTKWKLSWLNFYWSQSWAPTLIQTNAPPSNQGSVKASLTAANYTGQLYAWVDFTFKTLCDFDYSSYPYDTQICCYKLEDKQYYSVEFLLANSIETDATASARRLHPSGWTVEKVTVRLNNYQAEVRQDWSHDPFHVFTNNVDVCATFGRDSSYANAELIGPAIAPALITLISFFVGDFRTQIYLLVTSVGLQMVSSICVQFRLPPPSGETPAFCNNNFLYRVSR